jgi:hypothetical protein
MKLFATKLFGQIFIFPMENDEPYAAAKHALDLWSRIYELDDKTVFEIETGLITSEISIELIPLSMKIEKNGETLMRPNLC